MLNGCGRQCLGVGEQRDALEMRKRMSVTRRGEMVEFAIEHDLVHGAAGIESAVH